MIDVARCRGPVAMALALLGAMALVDLGLTALVGPADRWLPHGEWPTPHLATIVKKATGRLSAIARWRRSGEPGSAKPLCVLLGQSSFLSAVDPEALAESSGLPMRFLTIGGVGGSILKIAQISDLLTFSRLRPDVVVIAINDFMLAGSPYEPWERVEGPKRMTAAVRAVDRLVGSRIWTWKNRPVSNYLVELGCHQAKLAILGAFGRGAEDLAPPAPDPWRAEIFYVGRHFAREELADYVRQMGEKGRFDPERFHANSSNPVMLVEMARRYRSLGAEFVVVLLPTHSLARARMPAEADRCLAEVCGRPGGRPIPVLDLRGGVPDTFFEDAEHLDLEGRRICSRLLGERLNTLLAAGVGTPDSPRP
jgi:hypothetical protein